MVKSILVTLLSLFSLFAYAQESEVSQENYNESIRLYNDSRVWLTNNENLDLVISNCTKAISLNPNNSDFYFALANAYLLQNALDSAKNKILIAINLAPGQSDYNLTAAHILFKQKNFGLAAKYYSKALDLNETSEVKIDLTSTFYNRGVSRLQLKKYELAINDFTACIGLDESFVGAYHNRGVTKTRLKQNKSACVDFEFAVKLGSKISQKYVSKYCK